MKIFVEAFKKSISELEGEILNLELQIEFESEDKAIEYANSIKENYDLVRIHYCTNDENKPCEIKIIK